MLARSLMHKYQNQNVELMIEHPEWGLWNDMGTGKTISSATALRDMMDNFTIGRALVVAPKRVALTTWPMEFRKWEHLQGIRTQVITGSKQERIQAVLKRADVHFVSRDNIAWLWETCGKKWPWDTVVIDESSSFKSQSSNRWKAMRQARRYVKRLYELTATPSPNGLHDLWAQIYLMDRGERLGATHKSFIQRWFNYDRSGYIIPKDHSEAEIHEILSDLVSHMKAEDYLDMPELIMNRIEVDLEPSVMKKYKAFEKDMIIQLNELTQVEVDSAAALCGKLLQFANGAMYTDELKNWSLVHDEKIEALKEVVEAHSGYPIMVAYNFKSDLQRIRNAFPDAVVMDDNIETQERWNSGKIKMLLTHPASSGHGLNLQGGSHIIVWFGLPWSLELYQQLNGRLYRQGQSSKTVIIHHIFARGTVDERVMRVLGVKGATQASLLDAVKFKDSLLWL